MRRHPALQDLSRDHHHALVLARRLRGASKASSLPEDAAQAVAGVHATWQQQIAPHFRLEERELLPLALCDPHLQGHATQLTDDHGALRELFDGLSAATFEEHRHALADRLEAHVRFEEQQFFPALQAHLSPDTLEALVRRLQPVPECRIERFRQDEEGIWVAELDCGHPQHVRHAPSFTLAPWVTDAAKRAERIGAHLPCPLCRMPRLPPCAKPYKQTPVWDAEAVPAGLRRSHSTRAGTWGRIEVQQGRVHYVLEDEDGLSFALRPSVAGIVAPERPHHIRPEPESRLRVTFLRVDP